MRSDKEMMELILNTANNDELIRAVIMNGSRANPKAKQDIFQDYDIVYIVTTIASFTNDQSWIDVFGERMIMQMPENEDETFSYLMQFMDGNRIDLTLIPVEKADKLLKKDSLSLLLLDKDDIVGSLPLPNDKDYYVKRPTREQFDQACNEFLWICTYIGKGLWREELPYVMHMYEQINRRMLNKMIAWFIGMKNDFSVNTGKCGKYYEEYLEKEWWDQYVATISDADYENIWKSLFTMGDLFRKSGKEVALNLNFEYPIDDDDRVFAYLHHIYDLPKDAKKIY